MCVSHPSISTFIDLWWSQRILGDSEVNGKDLCNLGQIPPSL